MTTPQETRSREQRQDAPHMTSPHEKQLKEQSHEVKEEHNTRFPKGEEHLHFDGNVYKDWMETIVSPQHLQHLEHHLQQQQQTQGFQATKLQMKRVVTQTAFEMFRLADLQVPPSKPKSIK